MNRPTAVLQRQSALAQGTFGTLYCYHGDSTLKLVSLELPWRNNRRNVSCIPDGRYECRRVMALTKGRRYKIFDVPDRTGILFHAGNWAGNTEIGLVSDSQGCVLLGISEGIVGDQAGISNSRQAIRTFESFMAGKDFTLTVENPI